MGSNICSRPCREVSSCFCFDFPFQHPWSPLSVPAPLSWNLTGGSWRTSFWCGFHVLGGSQCEDPRKHQPPQHRKVAHVCTSQVMTPLPNPQGTISSPLALPSSTQGCFLLFEKDVVDVAWRWGSMIAHLSLRLFQLPPAALPTLFPLLAQWDVGFC